MMCNTELVAGPDAVVHRSSDQHVGGVVPFYIKQTLTASERIMIKR